MSVCIRIHKSISVYIYIYIYIYIHIHTHIYALNDLRVLGSQEMACGWTPLCPSAWNAGVCEQKHSFCRSRCPATQQHKFHSSPWFGVVQASFPRGLLLWRNVFFTDTGIETQESGGLWRIPCTLSDFIPLGISFLIYLLWRWGVTCPFCHVSHARPESCRSVACGAGVLQGTHFFQAVSDRWH